MVRSHKGFSRYRVTRVVGSVSLYAGALLIAFVMIMPLVWLVRSSFMGMGQIFRFPPEWIPKPWQFENYPNALTAVPLFPNYFGNTMIVLVPTVVGTVLTASISAFGFSRLRWPGRDIVFGILMTALMLPYAVVLIPTFLLFSGLGLVNTHWPLIIPYWFGGNIFFVFLLRQFFRTIPSELDQAAFIDGANPLQILFHIIIPLSKPALIAAAIFSGLFAWNDFLGPLVYLHDSRLFTLALGLSQFTGMYTSQWHLLMAASTVIILPVVMLFFIAQRYFIEGITLTGTKG